MTPADFSRVLHRVALSGAHIFAWIFIFQYSYIAESNTAAALVSTALTYALTQVVTVLATPWSAMRIRNGIRRALVRSSIYGALGFAILGAAIAGYLGSMPLGILLFSLLLGMYRALYWIPYEVQEERAPGKENGMAIAFIPAIAGILLVSGLSAALLLFAAAALLALSIFTTKQTQDKHEGFAWGYRETFHELFSQENRRGLTLSVFDGIEAAALLLIWPISVFLLLDWSYGLLGIVLTVTLLCTIVLRRMLHGLGLSTMPTFVSAALAGSAWIMRLIVTGPIGIVVVDTYSHAGRLKSQGIDAHAHEQSAENRTYIDEYTALKEMGMALGRAKLCLLVAIVASGGSLASAVVIGFVTAAIAAAASVFVARS